MTLPLFPSHENNARAEGVVLAADWTRRWYVYQPFRGRQLTGADAEKSKATLRKARSPSPSNKINVYMVQSLSASERNNWDLEGWFLVADDEGEGV